MRWSGPHGDLGDVTYRKLEVVTNVPVHMEVMTFDETLKMVEGGRQRVKEFCAEQVAKGDYFPGCAAALR